jgi:hypothetical protein
MSRTHLDMYTSMATAEVNHFTEKVESELRWLEGHIRDLRKEVERGNVFDQINLVTAASRVAYSAGKLRAAQESVTAFKAITDEIKGA